MSDYPVISWTENGATRSARWHSERGVPPPRRVVIANDTMTADAAYRLACEGTAMLWRGDFQNARQMLQAMARRADGKSGKPRPPPASLTAAFHLQRQARSQRARTLGMLLLPLADDYSVPLKRAPDVRQGALRAGGGAGRSV